MTSRLYYAHAQTVDTRLSFSLPTKNLSTRLNCTMHYITIASTKINHVLHWCCYTNWKRTQPLLQQQCTLRSRTCRAWLTLAYEGSCSLAKLQPIHKHLLLTSGSHWGCRMSENKRWEVVHKTSSLCVRYIWTQYLTTETQYQTLCVRLSVSEVEDYSLCHSQWWF